MQYLFYFIICSVVLYGFAMIEQTPTDRKEVKRRDQVWTKSFQQMTRIMRPIIQSVTDYVESIQTRPRTHNTHFSRQKVHYTTGFTHTMAYTAIITMSMHQSYHISESIVFDTDSQVVGIDNHCSACITHVCEDMPGELIPCHQSIKGFGGSKVWNVWHGTIKWCIEDDTGAKHTLIIPNSYYVPQAKVHLLSPQHWAQAHTGADKCSGAGKMTTAVNCTLFWNNKTAFRTIPIDIHGNNVATFHMSMGFQRSYDYCAMTNVDEYDSDPLTQMEIDTSLISDDKESEKNDQMDMETDSDELAKDWTIPSNDPSPRSFDLNGPMTTDMEDAPNVIIDEED